jgi:hypothetical protein
MRTLRPAEMADFFRNVFELAPANKKPPFMPSPTFANGSWLRK